MPKHTASETFGGAEPETDPAALDRAADALEALAGAPSAHDRAVAAMKAALRSLVGEAHAEFRRAYDKLVARTLTVEEMRFVAGRLSTDADAERWDWGTKEGKKKYRRMVAEAPEQVWKACAAYRAASDDDRPLASAAIVHAALLATHPAFVASAPVDPEVARLRKRLTTSADHLEGWLQKLKIGEGDRSNLEHLVASMRRGAKATGR